MSPFSRTCLYLALIVCGGAVLIFRGITTGLPSSARQEVELGGSGEMAAALPRIRTYLATTPPDRSEFLGLEHREGLAALSPWFDQLRTYHPDEQYILKVLFRMVRDRDFQTRNYIYPPFFFYQVGAGLALGRLTGYLQLPSQGVVGLLSRPETAGRIYLAGRVTIGLMALAGIVAVFLGGWMLGGRAVGLTAAALTAAVPLYALAGKFIKPDIPCFWWSTLTMFFSLRAFRSGRRTDYLLAGVMVGLATGSKYPGVLCALFPVGYFLARHWPVDRHFRRLLRIPAIRSEFLSLVLAGAASLLAFTVTNPSWLLDRRMFFQDFGWIAGVLRESGFFSNLLEFVFCFAHDGLCYHTGVVMLPLLAAGMIWALVKPCRAVLPLAAVAAVYVIMGSRGRPGSDAYLLPALAPLTVMAALMLQSLRRRWLSHALLGMALVSGVLYSAALDAAAAGENVRLTASRWIQRHLPAGSTIGRYQYPVSYRTAMTPPRFYPTTALLTEGRGALDCDYFVVTSFEWENSWSPWRIRLRGMALPPPPSPDYRVLKVFSRPPEILGLLPMRERGFLVSPYLDTIAPVIVIYQRKGRGQHVQR